MFAIAETDINGTIISGSITVLSPAPSIVRYPDKFINEVRQSRDGNPIVQSPTKDTRPRQWVWTNYTSEIAGYDLLYNRLLNYQKKVRETATPPKSPWIYLQEDASGDLTYRQWSGSEWIETETWVKVIVTQVTQNVADRPGHTTWSELIFEFVIDEPAWNLF